MTSSKDQVKYVVPLARLVGYYSILSETAIRLKEEINQLNGPVVIIGVKERQENLKSLLAELESKMRAISKYTSENGFVLTHQQLADMLGSDLETAIAAGRKEGKLIYL